MSNENIIDEKKEIKLDTQKISNISPGLSKGKTFGFFKKAGYFFSGMSLSFIFLYSFFIDHIVKSDKNFTKEMEELKMIIKSKNNENEKDKQTKFSSANNEESYNIASSLSIEKSKIEENTNDKI
jgi:hypothetical protein